MRSAKWRGRVGADGLGFGGGRGPRRDRRAPHFGELGRVAVCGWRRSARAGGPRSGPATCCRAAPPAAADCVRRRVTSHPREVDCTPRRVTPHPACGVRGVRCAVAGCDVDRVVGEEASRWAPSARRPGVAPERRSAAALACSRVELLRLDWSRVTLLRCGRGPAAAAWPREGSSPHRLTRDRQQWCHRCTGTPGTTLADHVGQPSSAEPSESSAPQ